MAELRLRWTKEVPGVGGHHLALNPRSQGCYVADGWGVALPAVKLRLLDLSSGTEIATARVGNYVGCVAFDQDSEEMIVATVTPKLFRLGSQDLSSRGHWKRRIPRYPHQMAWRGQQLVMAGLEMLCIFDLGTEQTRRLKVDKWPLLLEAEAQAVLVSTASTGSIDRLELRDGTLRRLFDARPFISCDIDQHDSRIWMTLGSRWIREERRVDGGSTLVHRRPGSMVVREYDLSGGGEYAEHLLPEPCRQVVAGRGQAWFWPEPEIMNFGPAHQLSFAVMLVAGVATKLELPPGHAVAGAYPNVGVIMTYHDWDFEGSGRTSLSCFELA